MQIRRTAAAESSCYQFFAFTGDAPEQVFAVLDERGQQIARDALGSEASLGKAGEVHSISSYQDGRRLVFVCAGLGEGEAFTWDVLRRAVSKSAQEWQRLKLSDIAIFLPEAAKPGNTWAAVLAETAVLAAYRFETYLQEKKPATMADIQLPAADEAAAEIDAGIAEGRILAEATVLARELVNEPANVLTPAVLGERAVLAGREYGFQVEVLEEETIADLGMKAFLDVGRASANRPRLLLMRYFGDPEHSEDIWGLVGKGLTFDSGGLSIKPGDSMLTMKCDMGGAAAVIGTMSAAAKMQLKTNIVAVVAACENLISGTGYRPGDIIETMAGKTVFIASTDAEGRLTLADAIHYIIEKEKVSRVVDVATLTGAAVVALGHVATAVITNDQQLYQSLDAASRICGEKVWQLPNFPEYKELNKHKQADLTNSGGRAAGTISAGLFVGEFVQNKPWLHLDIAGTAFQDKPLNGGPEGGTGVGVRLLYAMIKERRQQP